MPFGQKYRKVTQRGRPEASGNLLPYQWRLKTSLDHPQLFHNPEGNSLSGWKRISPVNNEAVKLAQKHKHILNDQIILATPEGIWRTEETPLIRVSDAINIICTQTEKIAGTNRLHTFGTGGVTFTGVEQCKVTIMNDVTPHTAWPRLGNWMNTNE